ncbi:SWIM zinc finger family protein [Neobacillus terrae]|uniref:SWIM zinc finger family protein n=1 Tax=Neobacillus terrae TaxID=3034837 RepID=UPI00140DD3C4|nr:SWIM zinc finger family protein [Neobacillus terrae]NHM31686.1 hypothetical protein [Neobacillus terrae]
MNIYNFSQEINKTILDRGYTYFEEGYIKETYKKGHNEYYFNIEGTEDYEVVVQIGDNGEILYSYCDCPFDSGPICKHQVAAYFELLTLLDASHNSKPKVKSIKRPTIDEVLNNLSKEELVSIILEITDDNDTLKSSLIVRYSKGDAKDEFENRKKLIDSIVRKYYRKERFIHYREVSSFVREMETILEKIENTEDVFLALDIAFLFLEKSIGAFQFADDSGGDIGFLVRETIAVIEETVNRSKEKDFHQQELVFNTLLKQIDKKYFEGWEDYEIQLLGICAEFAHVPVLRNELRTKIDSLIDQKSSNQYSKYGIEELLQILFNIIEKYGAEEEAEQFINEHLNFTSFRERLINKFIQEKNFSKVIELAEEGEKKDTQLAGLVSKWKKLRYLAYKGLSLKAEQEKLAKELFFKGDFEYYKELKELAEGDKSVFYSSLKNEMRKERDWRISDMFRRLIEEENDLDEIMEFVRRNPERIETYAEMLLDQRKEEVIEIYKDNVKSSAKSSSNRKEYKVVCRKIKEYKKIAGKQNQTDLINELRTMYLKRPAFIDELGKI